MFSRPYASPCSASQRLAALSSQSCFSLPSWGVTNSGASGMTFSQPGLTSTGVTTVWKWVTVPLACRRVEHCPQWMHFDEKYSVPSKASSRLPFSERCESTTPDSRKALNRLA